METVATTRVRGEPKSCRCPPSEVVRAVPSKNPLSLCKALAPTPWPDKAVLMGRGISDVSTVIIGSPGDI